MDTKQNKNRPRRTTARAQTDAPQRRPSAQRTEVQKKSRKRPRQEREQATYSAPQSKQRRSAVKKAKPAPRRAAPVKKNQKPAPTPDVVYTPARPFNRGRLLVQLATIVAVVLALSFGISVFFKVETITVSGAEKYDVWTIKEASGIEIGDNLLSFGEAKAAGKIKTALPYVESVRIGIKLPDTVNIEIKELDVVYSIKDSENNWWLITAEGKVVEKVDSALAGEYTVIDGVTLTNPVVGQQAVAKEQAPAATGADDSTDATGATAPVVTVRAADQLKAALQILQYLEECGIIGGVASINVMDLGNLELRYGQRFRVKLGDTTQLLYKIQCMNAAINGKDPENTLKEYDSGVLDISFTIKENQVIYQPGES